MTIKSERTDRNVLDRIEERMDLLNDHAHETEIRLATVIEKTASVHEHVGIVGSRVEKIERLLTEGESSMLVSQTKHENRLAAVEKICLDCGLVRAGRWLVYGASGLLLLAIGLLILGHPDVIKQLIEKFLK